MSTVDQGKDVGTAKGETIPAEWLAEFEAAARRPLKARFRYGFIKTYKPVMDDAVSGRSTRWSSTATAARRISRIGWAMAAFEYRQAEGIRDVFTRHGVRYLFIGKSGAILLGYPDTTQDADVFVEKAPGNGRRVVAALKDLGFSLSAEESAEVERGKDFVQIGNGPFDLDLVFARDGIKRFEDAWRRRVEVEGFEIIASKAAANRAKDRESLERLKSFREYWIRKNA